MLKRFFTGIVYTNYLTFDTENDMIQRRNPVAKDLRTPKYRMRVVATKKIYNRNKVKSNDQRQFYNND